MEKQVAVVSGGTGGLGAAISRRLCKDYKVIVSYFKDGRHEVAREWQAQQQQQGFDFDICYADVTKYSDCTNLVDFAKKRYGRIDVLVNNAGVTSDHVLKKMTPEQWAYVIDSNLNSIFNLTRNTIELMLNQQYGRIITISSINGRKGQFGQCNYAASKAAMFGFSKSLAQEVAGSGITVNTISPGYMHTHLLDQVPPDIMSKIISNIPVGRLGSPHEVASAVAFIASAEAGFITGANLDINGGQYM